MLVFVICAPFISEFIVDHILNDPGKPCLSCDLVAEGPAAESHFRIQKFRSVGCIQDF
jgi:hypothetical protein